MNAVKTIVKNAFNGIKSTISSVMGSIKSTVSSIWTNIKSTVSGIVNGIKSATSSAFKSMHSAIKGTISSIASTIKNGLTNAFNTIKSIPKQAYTWGRDMIIGDSVKSVANKIKSLLHFSRPDEGPLRDYETWMPDFMDGLAKGVRNNKHKLVGEIKSVASDVKSKAVFTSVLDGKNGARKLINASELKSQSINAPELKNVSKAKEETDNKTLDDRIITLLTQIVKNTKDSGDITIPIYLGNDLIDERIVKAKDRITLRSGGRA